jgi:CRISPR/Cas system-associated exonuclease Cas4 (RecB family)
MKPFLKQLAEEITSRHPKMDDVTVIFPNRRAALYFRKYLSELLTKPSFAPSLLTIEDFIAKLSPLKVPDKLELVSRLHRSYHEVINASSGDEKTAREPFDRFYFWGDMLLRDFDEADRYMVNAEHLFKDLSHQKELDTSFDFLTEEQLEFLRSFWNNFDENQSANKRKFLRVWRKLPTVYKHFREQLANENLAYEGMLHREVAENLKSTVIDFLKKDHVHFAGFNALTLCEEKILEFFFSHFGAKIHWDLDDYYVNSEIQEAGKFFREYQKHPILGKTFSSDVPANLLTKKAESENPKIHLFGAAQPIGQAKLMASVLNEKLQTFKPDETLIVLPDEKLLIPVLHGVSGMVDALNVTMGFPLSSTPLSNLVEILIDLQLTRKGTDFNHRQVLAILSHPYVIAADAVSSNNKRKEILKHNWVHIPEGFLASETDLHRIIFRNFAEASLNSEDPSKNILQYLKVIVLEIGSLPNLGNFDREYAYHFITFFNRLEEVLTGADESDSTTGEPIDAKLHHRQKQAALKSFLRLLKQLVQSQKIPFTGEPLRGLQIMGVLETRNLDFKNVFILSLNEGSFPSMSNKSSYIPFNIRKAYGLPTAEHQDAIYAYLFYRVLQRAENIFLFYNSETDVLGQGEMSRYLQQLLYESGLPVSRKTLHNTIQPRDLNAIVVRKNAQVLEDIYKLNEGNIYFQGISPSALNSYIECRLKFYFRHIAKIKEANEVEEELDARVLGNFLHDVMENFYKNITLRKNSREIGVDDYRNYEKELDKLIDQVFIEAYRLDSTQPVEYEGQRLVVKEIVKRFAHRIIEMDKAYAPFIIEGLEQGGILCEVPLSRPPYKAVVSGKIDRVDRKGDLLRIIDYKTGKDKLNFDSIVSLFARDTKRNKAAFQTLLYALLYKKSMSGVQQAAMYKIVPGLINRLNLFDDEFSFGLRIGKENITDVDPLLPEFEAGIKNVFEELFDPEKPFDQTSDVENCKLCAYSQICYR